MQRSTLSELPAQVQKNPIHSLNYVQPITPGGFLQYVAWLQRLIKTQQR